MFFSLFGVLISNILQVFLSLLLVICMDGSFKSGSGVRALAFVSCFGMVIALHSVVTDLLACKLALI